jgi:hypothetical protein
MPTSRVFASIVNQDAETRVQFEQLRRMRNNLVHGIEMPDPRDLREAARQLNAAVAVVSSGKCLRPLPRVAAWSLTMLRRSYRCEDLCECIRCCAIKVGTELAELTDKVGRRR